MKELKTYATHFCGFGGACYGIHQAGLECNFAIDSDHDGPAVETRFKNINHMAVRADITDYPFPASAACDLLWSSPPCQTFSTSAREQSNKNPDDERNWLFLQTVRFAKQFKPRFVVVENVTGLMTHKTAEKSTALKMRKAFEEIGYPSVEWNVLNAYNFGLPQERERFFIIASLDKGMTGMFPEYPKLAKMPTFGDIMEHNSTATAWKGHTYATAMGKVERLIKKHGSFKIKVIGPDDVLPTVTCGFGGGATRKKVAILDIFSTPAGEVEFCRHPTLLEGLRAQGFPDSWLANLPVSVSDSWNMIGNAVPAPLSKVIVEHLKLKAVGKNPLYKAKFSSKRAPSEFVEGCVDEVPAIEWQGK